MEVTIDGTAYTLTHRVGGNNGRLGVLLSSGTARHILSDSFPMDLNLNDGEFCVRVRSSGGSQSVTPSEDRARGVLPFGPSKMSSDAPGPRLSQEEAEPLVDSLCAFGICRVRLLSLLLIGPPRQTH